MILKSLLNSLSSPTDTKIKFQATCTSRGTSTFTSSNPSKWINSTATSKVFTPWFLPLENSPILTRMSKSYINHMNLLNTYLRVLIVTTPCNSQVRSWLKLINLRNKFTNVRLKFTSFSKREPKPKDPTLRIRLATWYYWVTTIWVCSYPSSSWVWTNTFKFTCRSWRSSNKVTWTIPCLPICSKWLSLWKSARTTKSLSNDSSQKTKWH